MLWLQSFYCKKCDKTLEQYVEKQDGCIEEPKCPECNSSLKITIDNPKHHKHASMSSWRIGHAD